jgi:diaminopimelate decarboxylase
MNKIGNIDIKELADNFQTPLYVYDQNKIVENYNKLKDAFEKYYENFAIHYSVKANTNLHILKLFNSIGCGADCSSPVEFKIVKEAGFEDNKIIYTGNYESLEDFETLKNNEIIINLDDLNSFDKLLSIKKPDLISFRINPGIGRGGFEGITTGGTDAKFGIPYEKLGEAYQKALDAGITRFGIHMMTGSNNLEPYYFAEIVDKLLTISGTTLSKLNIIPEFVDIGGGYGVPYEDNEEELDLDLTARLITEVFEEKCKKFGFGKPKLIIEPGRFLIANAGYLISKVNNVKSSYKTFVGIDAGMNTLIRQALYGAFHRIRVYNKTENKHFVNICGPICENSDIFVKHYYFPEVVEGDLLIFLDAGAYSFSMASNYNSRLRPAEILVDSDTSKVIRRRETLEDMLSFYK